MPDVLYIRGTPSDPPPGPPLDPPLALKTDTNSNITVSRDMATDPRLKHLDVRVALIIKGCQWGPEAQIGGRLLAKLACANRKKVAESLERLQETGWVEALPGEARERSRYRVAAVKWNPSKESPAETSNTPISKSSKIPKRPLVTCPVCATKCRQILKAGWCRQCATVKRIERVARRVAREEIKQEKTA